MPKKIKKIFFLKFRNKAKTFKLIWIIVLLIVFCVIFILFIVRFFQNTVFSKENYVKSVKFTDNAISQYYDASLYSWVRQIFFGQNFYNLKYIKPIQNIIDWNYTNPIIKKIEIKNFKKNILTIDLDFNKPRLLIVWSWQKRWIRSQDLFLTLDNTWRNISDNVQKIYLPNYLENTKSLSWLWSDISLDKYIADIQTISNSIQNLNKIIYLVWSGRTCVFIWDIKVFFYHKKDIDFQIKNLLSIISKQTFENNKTIQDIIQIDLWSIENPIITFR